ncbi:MAG: anti-sigma factor family protein [Alphaproteobacteria bacterium]
MPFRIITDFDIQAMVDGELSPMEVKKVRAHLDRDPNAQKRYQELKRQKALLRNWYDDRSDNSNHTD